ncbi:MAG: hypothetical protein NTW87_35705 [Planctomycetota bacterium]|nr:hypothetical protein [Planctomycetota bacterium]
MRKRKKRIDVDEMVTRHPEFRASIRKARRNLAEGKGIPFADAKRRLGV